MIEKNAKRFYLITGRVQHPVVSFSGVVVVTGNFHETFVQRQVVSDTVLPALKKSYLVINYVKSKL